jgi:hypothetical protein
MGLHRVKDKKELWRLKSGCRNAEKESNLEPAIDTPFLIHSPFSGDYYKTKVESYTDWNILDEYINAGNVYKNGE